MRPNLMPTGANSVTARYTTPFLLLLTVIAVVICTFAVIMVMVKVTKGHTKEELSHLNWHSARISAELNALTRWDAEQVEKSLSSLLAFERIYATCLYKQNHLSVKVAKDSHSCPRQIGENDVTTSHDVYIIYIAPLDIAAYPNAVLLVKLASDDGFLISMMLLLTTVLISAISAGFLLNKLSHHEHMAISNINTQAIKHLQRVAKEIQNTDDYKIRADDFFDSELQSTIESINDLLSQAQDNENQIHELAISLQEKDNELESQRKLHLDRNENLQKMFAGASHDLRQPLQAMVIFIAALKESADPNQKPLVQKLEQVVDNLDHMFSDLLDLSKLESRMKRIPKQTVEIHPLLTNIYDEFEALANEKKIELRLHNRDISVYSNPNMLERIIRNMISNAIRYTRTGGVLIGIRKRKSEIWIEVWDSGRGIPQEKMSEIFNEFVQIKDSESETNRGVGLGLFIVKRLAELLDHSIIVKSKIHQGTLFRVVVPSRKSISTTKDNKVDNMGFADVNITQLLPNARHCICIIDDDASVRLSLKALLESWNMSVIDFESVAQAEQQLPSITDAIDLIISDFQLGESVTGFDALAALRTIYGQHIPAIIITGTTDTDILNAIKESGTPMLRKPVKPAKLRALINTLASKPKDKSVD